MKQLMMALTIALLATSCANGPDTGESITVSGKMGEAKKNHLGKIESVTTAGLASYNFVCTAFNAAATKVRSGFGDDGSFSVNVPAFTPFSCAIVDANDAVLASIKIKDTKTGMEDQSSSSMSLQSSVNVGSLIFDEDNPVIEIPIAKVATAQAVTVSKFSIDQVHNTSWKLTCVDRSDTQCSDFLAENSELFLRIVKATKNGSPVYGLGVWSTQADFNSCGAIDLTNDDKDEIKSSEDESGEFTWTSIVTAATFSNATSPSSACPLRGGSYKSLTTMDREVIQNYKTMSKLVINGNIFSLNDEDEDDSDTDCYYYNKTAVTFSPLNSTTMMGSFETAEIVSHKTGSCGDDEESDAATFVVKFTKI